MPPQTSPDYLASGRHGSWYVVATWPGGHRSVVGTGRSRKEAEDYAAELRSRWEGGPQLAVELDFAEARQGAS